MKKLLFLMFFGALPAYCQAQQPAEYVVLGENSPSFFATSPEPEFRVDHNLVFKDTDRATKAYYSFFSKPIDFKEIFRDCRAAYQPDIFDEVTRLAQHNYFPELP